MKFTLSWLKDHLDTQRSVDEIATAMTMAGLEVEHVLDPGARLAPFTVARIVEAVQHPNADRLRVCQVETVDGLKEIVCGAPNARAGLTTIYAPIGAYVPGLGVTLVEKPVRGVVSNGMLCSASELEQSAESDGILELDDTLAVGAPAAEVFAAEPVIDFEVTPNRPDWLGVAGIARDLAAAGAGALRTQPAAPVAGAFPSPISVRIEAAQMCPVFAGRLIRGVRNGPSPRWLQDRLKAVGLRPINALVDVTNLISYDRARPMHVYDARLLVGAEIVVRGGQHADAGPEHLIALDGKTYACADAVCVIADAGGERPIGLGGVMGGESTAVSDKTVDVFVESAWFDPLVTAQTGRTLNINSDAQYRFARGVDPEFVVPGLDLATKLILELCGGEPSQVVSAGQAPARKPAFDFDPAYVQRLSGLAIDDARIRSVLTDLGFEIAAGAPWRVQPPSWRRDVDGPADLVEEVARIIGYDALPSTPLPDARSSAAGVLNGRQARVRAARRTLAAIGWSEAVTWSFVNREAARLFGGGENERLVLANPIASELDTMRPSVLPGLIQAAQRNAARGFPDAALFEIGPIYAGDAPSDQATSVSGVLVPHPPRDWRGEATDALFDLKADVLALAAELGAPATGMQLVQSGLSGWWRPGRSAALQLGPKGRFAEFGELHPRVLKALDASGPMYGFELVLERLPEAKRKVGGKARARLDLSPFMPLGRDFAFVVPEEVTAGDIVRAVAGADKTLIAEARVFDLFRGPAIGEGRKSLAIEIMIQPRERTLTETELEQLSARVIEAAVRAGAVLRT